MRRYLQHGRRHAPTGTDPIPGLGGGGYPWAFLEPGGAITIGTNATAAAPSGLNYQFYTSDSSIFSATTVSSGGTKPAISLDVAGHYLVQAILIPDSSIPDGVAYGVGVLGSFDADESTLEPTVAARIVPTGENAAFTTPNAVGAQTVMWSNFQSLGDGFVAPPAQIAPKGRNFSGTTTISVDLYAVVYYLDTDTTFIS